MRYLFIAEKKSLMDKVRETYQKNTEQVRQKVGDIDFIALTGHVCRYMEPKEYRQWKELKWAEMPLPLVPDPFVVTEIENDYKKRVLKNVKTALRDTQYDGIIVGTDSDTEGNGIYYLLCEYLKLRSYKTLRFFEESLTEKEILASLLSMTDFYNNPRDVQMTDSFLLRSKFDWILGMNATIAVTRSARTLFKVGRVKAQTMNIVYGNSNACDNFKPHSDYEVHALYADGFTGILSEDGKPVSFERREQAEQFIQDNLSGIRSARVSAVERKRIKTKPLQMYKLSTLQVDAGAKYNMSPQDVLDTVQSMYQKGLVSYPRTDGEYISTQKAKELPRLVKAAGNVPGMERYVAAFRKADLERALANKKFVNNDEVKKSSHDALLPTGAPVDFGSLSAEEQNIYGLICRRLVAQFMPDLEEEKTTLDAEAGGLSFHSAGSVVIDPGWTAVLPRKNKAEAIPASVKKGDEIRIECFTAHEKKAAPPKRLTTSTLIAAMEGIAKFISDKALKKAFVQAKGIGTPATRAAIIDDIIKSGYMEAKGKANQLYITDKGRNYIKALEGMSIINPEQAAEWETYFQAVKAGTMKLSEAEEICFEYVKGMVEEVEKNAKNTAAAPLSGGWGNDTILKCPYCGNIVKDDKWSFHCADYKNGCGFSVNKQDGKVKEKHVAELIKNGKTGVIKKLIHSSKTGKDYDACLVLEPKGSQYATKAEFQNQR